jgi:DNA-binding MarR family transcriptional regulator
MRTDADPAPSAGTDADDVPALAAHLRVTVTRLARQLRQQGDTGLTPSQMSALTSIDRHGPLTLGALAEREGVAPPSITRVVGKLEEAGLVERRADPADGRVTLVTATVAGRDLLARTRKRKDVWLATRLAALDAGDRHRLAGALDALDRLTGRGRP